jgi:hypothetical protein
VALRAQWRLDADDRGTWAPLLELIGMFTFPPLLTAVVAHPAPFWLQLLLAPLTVLQHVAFGLPHQLGGMECLQLRPLAARGCTALHALLDPSALALGAGRAPAHCSEDNPSFFLVYTYMLVAVVLPTQLTYWSEQRHKLAFMRARQQAEGEARGADNGWEWWGQATGAYGPLLVALMCFWASASISWSMLTFAYMLAGRAVRLPALLSGLLRFDRACG